MTIAVASLDEGTCCAVQCDPCAAIVSSGQCDDEQRARNLACLTAIALGWVIVGEQAAQCGKCRARARS